jgi:hypothetical protein
MLTLIFYVTRPDDVGSIQGKFRSYVATLVHMLLTYAASDVVDICGLRTIAVTLLYRPNNRNHASNNKHGFYIPGNCR